MEIALFRFVIVWTILHIILFFVEWYKYKHSNWSWHGFKNYGMFDITYIVLTIDVMGFVLVIIMLIGVWIFQPIIK